MFDWLFSPDLVDSSPTAADFPVRICSKEEIPPEYYGYLEPLIQGGLNLSNILFVPKSRYEAESREYMLASLRDGILYLEKQPGCMMYSNTILRDHVGCICVTEDLLRGVITIYLNDTSVNYYVRIVYNRVKRMLFYPFINNLLGRPEDFDVRKAAGDWSPSGVMRSEQLALYRYSTEAYRFGDTVTGWQWWKTAGSRRKVKNQNSSACALGRTERGQVLIDLLGNRVDIWYLPAQCSDVIIKEKRHRRKLVIQMGAYERIPVKEIYIKNSL